MTVLKAAASTLSCAGISAAHDPNVPVLHDIHACFEPGKFTAIIGPNGSGKSTLLSCLVRQLSCQGQITLDGVDVRRMSRRAYAQNVAFLPQSPFAPEGVSVRGLVERGRTPHRRPFAPLSRKDHAAVDAAIERLSLNSLAERALTDLSGGQRQRAWLALVLAQDTPVLLLDEPTAFLDLAHQADLLCLGRSLATEGRTVIAVLHDLNLAAAFADDLLVIEHGRTLAFGSPTTVLTTDLLATAYGLSAEIIADPRTGVPVVLPRAVSKGNSETAGGGASAVAGRPANRGDPSAQPIQTIQPVKPAEERP